MNNEQKITVTTSDVLTITDAAELLRVTRMTVWRWVKTGKILSIVLGGVNLIPRSEVERIAVEVAAKQNNVG